MSLRTYQQQRSCCSVEYLVGNAAKCPAFQPAVAMRRHHDQIGLMQPSRLDDFLRSVSGHYHRADLKPILMQLTRKGPQLIQCAVAQRDQHIRWERNAWVRFEFRWHRFEQDQLSVRTG